ncbi:hypothetical protein [Acetanaerobacterium elongatum]|uniref:Uncharacterized protein n=1 Tax=Acetanaerobacterium elongatum TaxID=258515 RepID=A0A1G9XFK7_9FIRM|nr:hypothetical protein [Acetanaerobacterium elongatum]SDM95530.1 hypothetical protein SAMN05192585_10861 [Acetanaerobacterium elongatum]
MKELVGGLRLEDGSGTPKTEGSLVYEDELHQCPAAYALITGAMKSGAGTGRYGWYLLVFNPFLSAAAGRRYFYACPCCGDG